MQRLACAVLALLLASLFAALELITTKYPKTYFVFTLRNSLSFYGYSFIYGLAALVITLVVDSSRLANETGISNPWIQAIIIGISLRAFLHLRLFTVPSQTPEDPTNKPLPIGLETLTLLFEPLLLENISNDEDSGLDEFLQPYIEKYQNRADVKKNIMAHMPGRISQDNKRRVAFEGDLDDNLAKSIKDAMLFLLLLAGRKNFKLAFPLKSENEE